MRHLALGFGLGGVAVIALGSMWAERLAGPWMWNLGFGLGQVLAPSVEQVAQASDVDWNAIERDVAANEAPVEGRDGTPSKGGKKTAKPAKQAGGALFVSADRVLSLSKRAQVPASRYVAGSGNRPAGLQVAGVSGLGIGVQDGDVLTKVAGAEVRSSAAVISIVLKLRAKKAPAISGEFWRGQERWQIVFEMPYLEPKPGQSTPSTSGVGQPRSPAPVGSDSQAEPPAASGSVFKP